jgi:hypothetical protein
MVRNETPCDFEVEPNNDFPYATPMVWGMISGIIDQSNFDPNSADVDLYTFDVDVDSIVSFETWGPDPYQSDTALELYVGPDDFGFYYYTGVSNDDCYGWLSCLDVILPPANDLLGNMYADADYIINVTTLWLNKNFLYTLLSSKVVVPTYVYEVEPNETCATGQDVAMGDAILGNLADIGVCDYDNYNFTVTANSFVTIETDALDTAIALYDGSGTYLGCDDDNGTGYIFSSLLEGCLPPGDYCIKVRGYSTWSYSIGDYEMTITDGGSCMPTLPVYLGETGLSCDGGQNEFENQCY